MTIKLKLTGLGIVCAFVGSRCIGRCRYVVHEDSYYNSIENAWTANPVNIFEQLEQSLKKKYPNSNIIKE